MPVCTSSASTWTLSYLSLAGDVVYANVCQHRLRQLHFHDYPCPCLVAGLSQLAYLSKQPYMCVLSVSLCVRPLSVSLSLCPLSVSVCPLSLSVCPYRLRQLHCAVPRQPHRHLQLQPLPQGEGHVQTLSCQVQPRVYHFNFERSWYQSERPLYCPRLLGGCAGTMVMAYVLSLSSACVNVPRDGWG